MLLRDAVVAVTLVESSMQGAALIGASSPLHSSFPIDAEAEYETQQTLILRNLGLEHLLPDNGHAPTTRDHAPTDPHAHQPHTDNDSAHAADTQPSRHGTSSSASTARAAHPTTAPNHAAPRSFAVADAATRANTSGTRRRSGDDESACSGMEWDPVRQRRRHKRPRQHRNASHIPASPAPRPPVEPGLFVTVHPAYVDSALDPCGSPYPDSAGSGPDIPDPTPHPFSGEVSDADLDNGHRVVPASGEAVHSLTENTDVDTAVSATAHASTSTTRHAPRNGPPSRVNLNMFAFTPRTRATGDAALSGVTPPTIASGGATTASNALAVDTGTAHAGMTDPISSRGVAPSPTPPDVPSPTVAVGHERSQCVAHADLSLDGGDDDDLGDLDYPLSPLEGVPFQQLLAQVR